MQHNTIMTISHNLGGFMIFLFLSLSGCEIELPIFKEGNGKVYENGVEISISENDSGQQEQQETGEQETGEQETENTDDTAQEE